MADFWIDVKKVPLADLDLVRQLPGVSEIRPRIQSFATVDLERVAEPLNGMVLSLPDIQQPMINDIVLLSGSYFTDRRRNEVIVNDTFARRQDLHPGTVDSFAREQSPRGVVHCRHGDVERVCVFGGAGIAVARSGTFWRVLRKANLRRRNFRHGWGGESDRRRAVAAVARARDEVLRRSEELLVVVRCLFDHAAERSGLEPIFERRD